MLKFNTSATRTTETTIKDDGVGCGLIKESFPLTKFIIAYIRLQMFVAVGSASRPVGCVRADPS